MVATLSLYWRCCFINPVTGKDSLSPVLGIATVLVITYVSENINYPTRKEPISEFLHC